MDSIQQGINERQRESFERQAEQRLLQARMGSRAEWGRLQVQRRSWFRFAEKYFNFQRRSYESQVKRIGDLEAHEKGRIKEYEEREEKIRAPYEQAHKASLAKARYIAEHPRMTSEGEKLLAEATEQTTRGLAAKGLLGSGAGAESIVKTTQQVAAMEADKAKAQMAGLMSMAPNDPRFNRAPFYGNPIIPSGGGVGGAEMTPSLGYELYGHELRQDPDYGNYANAGIEGLY